MIATGVRWKESNARASRGEYEILGKTKADRITISDAEMTGQEEEKEYQQIVMPGLEEDVGEIMLMNDNSKKRRFIEQCAMKAKTDTAYTGKSHFIKWIRFDLFRF